MVALFSYRMVCSDYFFIVKVSGEFVAPFLYID